MKRPVLFFLLPFFCMTMAAHAQTAFTHKDLIEVSGIATSPTKQAGIWVINDSGNPAHLFAAKKNGEHIARFSIQGIRNRDFEDITAWKAKDGSGRIAIADVGDNKGWRHHLRLILIKEPLFSQKQTTLSPLSVIRFRYPDGPKDCEAVAADLSANRFLILSKRDTPPILYDLPMDAASDIIHTARRIGEIPVPRPTPKEKKKDPEYGAFGSRPTALSIAKDGEHLLLLTYKRLYLFSNPQKTPWEDHLKGPFPPPIRIPLKKLPQAESADFFGPVVLVATERKPPRILEFPVSTTPEAKP